MKATEWSSNKPCEKCQGKGRMCKACQGVGIEPLAIPAEYLQDLAYDIMILSAKTLKTFQCVDFKLDGQVFCFNRVIMDTSEKNARGRVTLLQVSYHEKVILGNTGFMAIPIPTPEDAGPPTG